jgi:VCBS repeat-containing protein
MANSRPVAVNDILPFMEFDVMSGNLLANDTGPARFLRFFDDVRVEAKQGPDQITTIAGDHGTFFVKPDGSFTYELDPEVAARIQPGHMVIEQLQYKVSDGMGGTDVGLLRMEISGGIPGLELVRIDFEDLEPGTMVPEGYGGFDWGDGWTVYTDTVGVDPVGTHVAAPVQLVDMISLESGEDFFLVDIVLNSESDDAGQILVRAFNDGVPHPFYVASQGAFTEPSWMDLQWEGIDAIEITRDPGVRIEYITAAIPEVI